MYGQGYHGHHAALQCCRRWYLRAWFDGQNVSDLESGFLSAVDELAGVHSLDSEEDLFPRLVTVRVAEVYDCQWGTSTRVVDNFLDYSFNVTMSLGEIFRAEF